MTDGTLRNALRREMRAWDEATPFDETWLAAEARYRRGRRRKAAVASLAAALAAVAILFATLIPEPEQVAFIEMAELLDTTSWEAPSDALLPTREFDIYQELPDLMESTPEVGGALL